jgi:hypothetical protein
MSVTPLPSSSLFQQRRLTRDILSAWGLIPAVYGNGKVPLTKITLETGKTVDPVAWAEPDSPQSKLNLLGRLSPSTIDLDLDVRLTDAPHTRPPQWSDADKALAEEWCYRPFRDEIKRITGDTRNHWGRDSMGGTGHWLIKLAPDDISLDERRTRLKQLEFKASLGPLTVKLEVRFPRKISTQLYAVLPGSRHGEDDYVRFYNSPASRDPHLLEIPLEALAGAVYGTALRIVTTPLTGEGERHNTALLVSGVLRREVAATEQEGGAFTRDDAKRLFEEIFAHDDELKMRRRVFEADFDKHDTVEMPGYPALGKRIGEDTAGALSRMLHGFDLAPVDRMKEQLVFLEDDGAKVINTNERTGSGNLTLYPRQALASILSATVQRGRKFTKIFHIVETLHSRRQADGWIVAPGFEQGAFLYQTPEGKLSSVRASADDRSLINIGPGWATPYVDEELSAYPDAKATLDQMLAWFSDKPEHQAKIMQMVAFKVQNPLVKPQFALAISGGQGIGKSTFFTQVLRQVMGGSVLTTYLNAVFDDRYTYASILGASLLIIEEADAITNFTMSKQLHRESQLDINQKYGAKGRQWCFGIPIYLTNKAEPVLNEPGAIDRTLYVIQAPTQYSLRLSSEDWIDYQRARTDEIVLVLAKLRNPEFRLALRQIFEEYEVTQQQLEDTQHSDSRLEDYRVLDLAPAQQALQIMLARGYIHHDHPTWSFDAPFTWAALNQGFNEVYAQHTGDKRAKPLTDETINKRLREMLEDDFGKLEVRQLKGLGRVYWFPVKLGDLRARFAKTHGVPLPDETEAEVGPNKHDVESCKRAWTEWAPKGRLTDRADY